MRVLWRRLLTCCFGSAEVRRADARSICLTAAFRTYGRSFVLVTAEAVTYVYCLEDKRWHEWSTTTPLWFRMAGLSTGTQVLTYAVSNISTSGKVFVINPSSLSFLDNGEAFTATIQTENVDLGTNNRKFWEELRVVCDIEPSA